MRWTEYDIQRIQDFNETITGKVVDSNLKIIRYNKTIHTISGDVTFNPNDTKKYEVMQALNVYHF